MVSGWVALAPLPGVQSVSGRDPGGSLALDPRLLSGNPSASAKATADRPGCGTGCQAITSSRSFLKEKGIQAPGFPRCPLYLRGLNSPFRFFRRSQARVRTTFQPNMSKIKRVASRGQTVGRHFQDEAVADAFMRYLQTYNTHYYAFMSIANSIKMHFCARWAEPLKTKVESGKAKTGAQRRRAEPSGRKRIIVVDHLPGNPKEDNHVFVQRQCFAPFSYHGATTVLVGKQATPFQLVKAIRPAVCTEPSVIKILPIRW